MSEMQKQQKAYMLNPAMGVYIFSVWLKYFPSLKDLKMSVYSFALLVIFEDLIISWAYKRIVFTDTCIYK